MIKTVIIKIQSVKTASMKTPKTIKKMKALSLFSGAGGMDIGVSQAGFEVLGSLELDSHCCDTLRENIKLEKRSTKVFPGDIRKVDPFQLMSTLGLKSGQLDLIFGGPPCQPFSQIGKQGSLQDDRGPLLFELLRFAEVFSPKAILIEQVKGLLTAEDDKGHKGGVFRMLLARLEKLGYVPKWQIINAADYGVPQLRKRVFIVATRAPNGFCFPDPTHAEIEDATASFLFPAKPHLTVGEAIRGLGRPSKNGNGKSRVDSHVDVTPPREADRIRGVPEGGYLGGQRHLPEAQVLNLKKKDSTKFRRMSRTKPANTLRCGEIFFHPTLDRYLTPREYMRIHGYPDSYVLKGPIRRRTGTVRNLDQHRQVSNSVPPPVAKALAEEIYKVVACHKSTNSLVTA